MTRTDLALLKKINSFYSLSGNEKELVKFLQKKLAAISTTTIDGAGNLICKKGKKANDLAIFAHVDKVGFMISKIKPAIQVVGLSPEVEGTIKNGVKYQMIGLGASGGVYEAKMKKAKGKLVLKTDDHEVARVGDYIGYSQVWREGKKWIKSPGLDDSLGLVVANKLFEALQSATLVLSVQEEMGYLGARKAVETLKLKKAYVIDVTYADDPDSCVVSGGGVSFCVKDKYFADKKMLTELIAVAKKESIKYQLEVIGTGGSDYGGIAEGIGIIPYVFIGIPIKNMHSSQEAVFIADFEAAISFAKALGKKIGQKKE